MHESRVLAVVLLVASMAAVPTWAASSPVDPVTGLAVYPGASLPDKMPKPQHYCGKLMDMSFATGPFNANVPTVVAWYQANLPGARHFQARPGASSNRSQDTFVMPDGLRQVTVTGTPNSDAVYSVSYGRFAVALTPKEASSFNASNQVCGS